MLKSRIAIVVIVLATVLASAAPATARVRVGLGPLGGIFGLTRLLVPGHIHRGHARHGRVHVRATRPIPRGEALAGARLLTDPVARGRIATTAALALWHGDRRSAAGWWSHGHDGYGWVGPLFWPFAYDDIFGHVLFGDDIGFWDYGYPDIYAGIFGPYRYSDLAAYMAPGGSGRRHRRVPSLQQLCGDVSPELAGLPIDQMRQAIQPTDAQRAALDDLAKVSISAAQVLQASCPTQTASTAPARLAVMQQRIQAMIKAVITLEPPLKDLYDRLDDEQKARLNALSADQSKTIAASGTALAASQRCEAVQPAALQWPGGEIEATLHPNVAQRRALEGLQHASARAADILSAGCRPDDATTPPARLFAVDDRLGAMQQAVNLVSDALENLYETLSDEQKAQFEAMGSKRTS